MKKKHLKHKLPAQQRRVMTWEPVQHRKAKNCNEKSFDGSKGPEESTFFIWYGVYVGDQPWLPRRSFPEWHQLSGGHRLRLSLALGGVSMLLHSPSTKYSLRTAPGQGAQMGKELPLTHTPTLSMEAGLSHTHAFIKEHIFKKSQPFSYLLGSYVV